jgi:hypothetical protein
MIIRDSYKGNFNPVVFSVAKDSRLEISMGRYCSKQEKLINPFSSEGKAEFHKAYEKGIYNLDYVRSGTLEILEKTIPELKELLVQAVAKAEKQQEKKKQDAALKKELLKQAVTKTNGNTTHLKNHVHFIR